MVFVVTLMFHSSCISIQTCIHIDTRGMEFMVDSTTPAYFRRVVAVRALAGSSFAVCTQHTSVVVDGYRALDDVCDCLPRSIPP